MRPTAGNSEAATAIEYALLVGSIAAIIVLVVTVLGGATKDSICVGSDVMEATGSSANANC